MAEPNRATKWNKRLNEVHWFKKSCWRVVYFLGRVFSLGQWNPLKKKVPQEVQFSTENEIDIDIPNVESRQPLKASTLQEFLVTDVAETEFLAWLSIRNISRVARTNKRMHAFFKNLLLIERAAYFIVVEPSEIEVLRMLNVDREPLRQLLQKKVKNVVNNSKQAIINSTLLQLAYGAGDDGMCLTLKKIFIAAFGEEAGIQEIQRQLKEKFADEETEESKLKDGEIKTHLGSLLRAAIRAITRERFYNGEDAKGRLILSHATLQAIETFRSEFAKTQPERIEKGMHFRYNTLQETYDAYKKAADRRWQYNRNKCALFEDGVLSHILFYAPANDAQKFSQGLYYLIAKNEPLRRSLALRVGEMNFYTMVHSDSSNFSLFGVCINIWYGGVVGTGGREQSWAISTGRNSNPFKFHVSRKHHTFRTYAAERTSSEATPFNLVK